jgi:putative endonuclease
VEARSRVRSGPGVRAHRSGADGEDQAVRFLQELGFRILERNFRTRFGEVDIIAADGGVIVFVEVKRRESAAHGTAAEFVSPAKMRRVVSAARVYAARNGLSEKPIRFDVVAIDVVEGREQLRHHRGAFDAR